MTNILLTAVLLLLGASCALGQAAARTHVVDARIALTGTEINGSQVVISYEIPYSGMVEIRLFDASGQKIWQHQYPEVFGKNEIRLKASKFTPGVTYAYQLNYKQDQVKRQFVIPNGG